MDLASAEERERYLNQVCAGPVLSHYEFEVTGAPRRISDSEWQTTVLDGRNPPESGIEGVSPPRWTESYLVPISRP